MSDTEDADRRIKLPPLLLRFWIGIVALTMLSVIYTLTMTRLHHTARPWGVQLLWGVDAGWDFNVFRARFLLFRTARFWDLSSYPFTYPAATGVLFGVLYKLAHPMRDYLLVCAAAGCAWVWWLAQKLTGHGISRVLAVGFAFTVVATCWPLWLLLDTANIEGAVIVVLALGLLAFVAKRCWLAALLIGCAGALKLFPLILLALLLSRRRYKEFAVGLLTTAVITLASLAILGPGIARAQQQIDIAFQFLTRLNIANPMPQAVDADHSLFALVRSGLLILHYGGLHLLPAQYASATTMLSTALTLYIPLIAILGLAAYVLVIRKLPMLNQVIALSTCAVLLPPTSLDYTLLHLLVPFGLLTVYAARSWRHALDPKGLALCLACFAIIFGADTFFTFRYPFTSPMRTLALLLLLAAALRYPLPWPELDAPQAEARV